MSIMSMFSMTMSIDINDNANNDNVLFHNIVNCYQIDSVERQLKYLKKLPMIKSELFSRVECRKLLSNHSSYFFSVLFFPSNFPNFVLIERLKSCF